MSKRRMLARNSLSLSPEDSPKFPQTPQAQLSPYSQSAKGWTVVQTGFDFRRRQRFFLFNTAIRRQVLGPTQPPTQWIHWATPLVT
jgi:hypothetical protein